MITVKNAGRGFSTFASLQKSVKKKQSSTKGFIDGKSYIKEYSNH